MIEFIGGPCDGAEAPPEAEELEDGVVLLVVELHPELLLEGAPPPMNRHRYRRQGGRLVYEGNVSGS